MGRIFQIIKNETKRQKDVISLIPSENFVSKDVLAALGSVFTNKYAEGKPRRRYYFGCKFADELEESVCLLVYKVFKISSSDYSVNVQPYSGSIANLAAYLGTLELGDKILSMALEHGGHLTHGHKASLTGKLFTFGHYGVGRDGLINYDDIRKTALEFKPKLIVAGSTSYPRKIDFKKFKRIADECGALLMADISHIAGLIAGEMHESPLPYADIVTSTTQKTLKGPRGAFIISRRDLSDKIDRAIFPGLQGGPQLHTISAMGVALEEALSPVFRKYIKQVVKNATALAAELKRLGFMIVSGGTDIHMLLIDLSPLGINGREAGEKLERAGMIVNKNLIPYDTGTAVEPSGIRLGTPFVTAQGMKEKDMITIAKKIAKILNPKS